MQCRVSQILPLPHPCHVKNDTLTMSRICHAICTLSPLHTALALRFTKNTQHDSLDDGWPESEKDVFQAALRMVVVKDSR